MADRNIKVLTPAVSGDFLTLAEAKTMLGITTETPEEDAQLQMMISTCSATIMRICNRIFAREEIQESWRELATNRVFLSHWPVKEADIESVTTNGTTLDPPGWDLEEGSGKLSNYGGWANQPVTVTYWGGYNLPDEAPLPLKQATIILIRDERILMRQALVAGIRQISHKEARVSFFDPNAVLLKQAGGMSQTQNQLYSVLYHYIRFEV